MTLNKVFVRHFVQDNTYALEQEILRKEKKQ